MNYPGSYCRQVSLSILFGVQIEGHSFTLSIGIAIVFIIFSGIFGLSMGPIPWVINSEIYPIQYTSVASSVAAMINFVTNATVTFIYGSVSSMVLCNTLIWIVIAVLKTIFRFFIYFVLPETKGKSQAKIQALFRE
jgi:hypothetical protein